MGDTLGLNRLEFNILKCLYDSGCVDPYHSMTITELLEKYEELEKRMTIYKKLRKLTEEKYVKKGITDNHADTFYLLEKALKKIEGKEPNNERKQLMDNNKASYGNDSVRNKLTDIIDRGLMLKSIAVNAGISESELSRFKSGVDALKESDMKLLADYLNVVYIPRWNKGEKEQKQMTSRERLLAIRNGSTEKVSSTRHWLFT
jgi:transcriptional regulator with XRE-family HTH domain